MRKARSTDLAPVGPLAAVTDQENGHLTLGRLDGGIGLPGRNRVALGEQEEVVDESLHVLLHGGTGGRRDLVVLDTDRAGRHLVQTLVDDAERLAEFLHTAEVSVVAVAVHTDGDVELDLVIRIVRLRLADIPRDTGSTEHHTREAQVQSLGHWHDTDALSSGLPDSVVREQFLGLVDAVAELGGPLVDIVEEAEREILGHTAWADVGGMEAGTGHSLIEFLIGIG